jgi:hypothetical protein
MRTRGAGGTIGIGGDVTDARSGRLGEATVRLRSGTICVTLGSMNVSLHGSDVIPYDLEPVTLDLDVEQALCGHYSNRVGS